MSTARLAATERVISLALQTLLVERQDPPPPNHAAQQELAFEALAMAARDLAVATSLLPWSERPVGWDENLSKAALAVDVDSEAVR